MKITVLPGDGIGVEVTREAVRVLKEVGRAFDLEIGTEEYLIGGAAIRESGSPLPDQTLNACLNGDAVLLGAVGSPEFDDLLPEHRPEIGLLGLRKALGGFANLRPAKAIPALVNSSPLRPEVFAGTDLLIVRELLGGLYFGTPRGFNSDRTEAFNTMRYSVMEIERVARVAFQSALSELLTSIISFGVQPNKAIVGRNAFAHEAGIHQHGVLSNPLCYEIMTPESVGIPKNDIVLGKHSGRHALSSRYEEMGFSFDPEEIAEIYSRFVMLADRKKNIYDQDLLGIVLDRNVAVLAA